MKESKTEHMVVNIICTALGTIIGLIAVAKAPDMASGTKTAVKNTAEGIRRVWGKAILAVTPKAKEDKPAA